MKDPNLMLTKVATALKPFYGNDKFRALKRKQLQECLAVVADVLDDFDCHNHNLQDDTDTGWFLLRDLLNATHDRLRKKV